MNRVKSLVLQYKLSLTLFCVALSLVAMAILLPFGEFSSALLDQDSLSEYVESTGVLAPVTFVAFQIVQVFIAPIPGQVTGLVGGYLFGVFEGTLLTTVGAVIGFLLILLITRKFGRPFVKRFVQPETMERFDSLVQKKGTLTFFILFLLPAFPDDMLCFIAGLTKIPIHKLLFISVLGRLPGYFVLSYMGATGSEGEYLEASILLVSVSVVSIVVYYYRNQIISFSSCLDVFSIQSSVRACWQESRSKEGESK